jgi:hypothetical protein
VSWQKTKTKTKRKFSVDDFSNLEMAHARSTAHLFGAINSEFGRFSEWSIQNSVVQPCTRFLRQTQEKAANWE